MWGQDKTVIQISHRGGIIPTRVGTSPSPCRSMSALQDHPHACGDKITGSGVILSPMGSFPRVWGQDHCYPQRPPPAGIIPTRVGTSSLNNKAYFNKVGSSPRVWGQDMEEIVEVIQTGIIPTRVGTRIIILRELVMEQDHPHACGDKIH